MMTGRRMFGEGRPRASALGLHVTFIVYLLAVAWMVFAPGDDAARASGIVRLALAALGIDVEPAFIVLEFVANIALFVPFGALLALIAPRMRVWAITAIGLGATITIELVQLAIPGRYSTVSDVIANTFGTLLGALVVASIHRRRHRRRRPALATTRSTDAPDPPADAPENATALQHDPSQMHLKSRGKSSL